MKSEEFRKQLAELADDFVQLFEEKGVKWKQGWKNSSERKNGMTGHLRTENWAVINYCEQAAEKFRKKLADDFVQLLEETGVEWKQGWKNSGEWNGVSGRPYRGLNLLNLFLKSRIKGYTDPRWYTEIQTLNEEWDPVRGYAPGQGCHPGQEWKLKKDHDVAFVEYQFLFDLVKGRGVTWEERSELIENKEREIEDFKILSDRYAVFNADCIDGVPPIELKRNNDIDLNAIVSKIAENMHIPIIFGGDRTFYDPRKDEIHIPEKGLFEDEYGLNATILHELAHATGHSSRLNRHGGHYGTPEYAFEELVVEMSSCFMAGDIGYEINKKPMDNHKAYDREEISIIKNDPKKLFEVVKMAEQTVIVRKWVKIIKNDPKKLFEAVKLAEQAANYLNYKAELITEKEYEKLAGNIKEVPKSETMSEDMKKLCAGAVRFIRKTDCPGYSLEQFHKDYPDMTHIPIIENDWLTVEFDFVNLTQTRYVDSKKLDTVKYKTADDLSLVLQTSYQDEFIPVRRMTEKAKKGKPMEEHEMMM